MASPDDIRQDAYTSWVDIMAFTLLRIHQGDGIEHSILTNSVCDTKGDSFYKFRTALELECIRSGVHTDVNKHPNNLV